MNDMTHTIIPKSDQLNADDLLAGPITIKITGVSIRAGQEQPVSISYEGDKGKPYKACKSMCRVMVSAWGADSAKYVGRSMTLYCDPKVKWGGMEVGGIRISHMSDIDSSMTMALTVTRANKKPFTVRPLKVEQQNSPPATDSSPASSISVGGDHGAEGNQTEVITADKAIENIEKAIDKDTLVMASELARTACKTAPDKLRASEAYRARKAFLMAQQNEVTQ